MTCPTIAPWPIAISFFFFNDTATTEIYTLSLHDALPISFLVCRAHALHPVVEDEAQQQDRSEEHTSELQSHSDLVCRLLLEKKSNNFAIVDGERDWEFAHLYIRADQYWLLANGPARTRTV